MFALLGCSRASATSAPRPPSAAFGGSSASWRLGMAVCSVEAAV